MRKKSCGLVREFPYAIAAAREEKKLLVVEIYNCAPDIDLALTFDATSDFNQCNKVCCLFKT